MFPDPDLTLLYLQTSLVMSVYLTISVSMERYISVVYPLLSIRLAMAQCGTPNINWPNLFVVLREYPCLYNSPVETISSSVLAP